MLQRKKTHHDPQPGDPDTRTPDEKFLDDEIQLQQIQCTSYSCTCCCFLIYVILLGVRLSGADAFSVFWFFFPLFLCSVCIIMVFACCLFGTAAPDMDDEADLETGEMEASLVESEKASAAHLAAEEAETEQPGAAQPAFAPDKGVLVRLEAEGFSREQALQALLDTRGVEADALNLLKRGAAPETSSSTSTLPRPSQEDGAEAGTTNSDAAGDSDVAADVADVAVQITSDAATPDPPSEDMGDID